MSQTDRTGQTDNGSIAFGEAFYKLSPKIAVAGYNGKLCTLDTIMACNIHEEQQRLNDMPHVHIASQVQPQFMAFFLLTECSQDIRVPELHQSALPCCSNMHHRAT